MRLSEYCVHFLSIGIHFWQEVRKSLTNGTYFACIWIEVLMDPFKVGASEDIADIDNVCQGFYRFWHPEFDTFRVPNA